jgi:hypothetical protein
MLAPRVRARRSRARRANAASIPRRTATTVLGAPGRPAWARRRRCALRVGACAFRPVAESFRAGTATPATRTGTRRREMPRSGATGVGEYERLTARGPALLACSCVSGPGAQIARARHLGLGIVERVRERIGVRRRPARERLHRRALARPGRGRARRPVDGAARGDARHDAARLSRGAEDGAPRRTRRSRSARKIACRHRAAARGRRCSERASNGPNCGRRTALLQNGRGSMLKSLD